MLQACGKTRLVISMALTALMAVWLLPARADAAEKAVFTLEQCIKRAVDLNSEIREAEFDAEVYRSKKEQADAGRWAQAELVAYGSLSPRARLVNGRFGNPDTTTNINKESYDGVFGRATIKLVQPIYTFGMIDGYRDAAQHGVLAYEAGAKLKATDVVLQVQQAYYGVLLGRDIKALLLDLKEEVRKATDKVSNQLDAGAPNVDQVDLFKLQTYQGEIDKYIADADEGIGKAMFGLRILTTCLESGEEFDVADEHLTPAEVALEEFNTYQDRALSGRLEFTMVREGIAAKQALIDVEKSKYYPQFFVLAFYDVAGASNRDHLNNPYIFDEFNHTGGGAVAGLKWGFDLGITKGRVDEATAEFLKVKMKEKFADCAIPFQVQDAYLEVQRTMGEMKALERAYGSAKQWLVASLSNFDLGVGEARDIADSVGAYGRIRVDYLRSVYNQRMALANLKHATGEDLKEIPYDVRCYSLEQIEQIRKSCAVK